MISWKERLARLPVAEEELVEEIARAIYTTHWASCDYHTRLLPGWDGASEPVRDWVRAQARSVVACIRSVEAKRR